MGSAETPLEFSENSTKGASAQGILKNSGNGVSAHPCARNLVPYNLKNKGRWSITAHGDPQKLHYKGFSVHGILRDFGNGVSAHLGHRPAPETLFPKRVGGVSLRTEILRNSTTGISAHGIFKNSSSGISEDPVHRNSSTGGF